MLRAIRPCIPQSFGTYYEPFVGGGAVFYDVAPPRAVLRDINEELITTYRVVRDHIDSLVEALEVHGRRHRSDLLVATSARGTHEAFPYYYEVRAQRPDELGDVARASRLLYLNKTCFNGLYRVNARGHFNVPAGRYAAPDVVGETNLRRCGARLAGVELGSGDFSDIEPVAGDFVYLDPPYAEPDGSVGTSFTEYDASGFGHEAQLRVRDFAVELKSRGVSVAVSNNDTRLIRRLYADEAEGFILREVLAPRALNSRSGQRPKAAELLIVG